MRDYQREKVYRAERTLDNLGRHFGDPWEIQHYLDRLCRSAWFRRRWKLGGMPMFRRHLRPTSGWGRAHVQQREITLPPSLYKEHWVLHELAHLCAYRVDPTAAPHGREFVKALLELTKHQRGREDWLALKAALKQSGAKQRGSDADWLRRNKARKTRAERIAAGLEKPQPQPAAFADAPKRRKKAKPPVEDRCGRCDGEGKEFFLALASDPSSVKSRRCRKCGGSGIARPKNWARK